MISHGKEIKVFTGNSNPALAEAIASELYRSLGQLQRHPVCRR